MFDAFLTYRIVDRLLASVNGFADATPRAWHAIADERTNNDWE